MSEVSITPDPVITALGYDRATDEVGEIHVDALPRTLPLYVPTIIAGVDDGAAAQRVADVLQRSLPSTAPIRAVTEDGAVDARIAVISDLESVSLLEPTWVHIPASDVRVEAIGALYAADVLAADAVDTEALSHRAAALARATWDQRDVLDARIESATEGWRIDRMNAVDRNTLRVGSYELLHTDLATGIVIDQAVEIAKRFSTARSGAFVNGILDAIAADRRP